MTARVTVAASSSLVAIQLVEVFWSCKDGHAKDVEVF